MVFLHLENGLIMLLYAVFLFHGLCVQCYKLPLYWIKNNYGIEVPWEIPNIWHSSLKIISAVYYKVQSVPSGSDRVLLTKQYAKEVIQKNTWMSVNNFQVIRRKMKHQPKKVTTA